MPLTAKPLSIDQDFCLQKIEATIDLANTLEDGDYPHRDSKFAITDLKNVYVNERNRLKSIKNAKNDTILEYCRRANINICKLKPYIGLILRSSNLRNAFEIYFPIKELAWRLLDNKPRVVLSSEWYFSPFTYPFAPKELPNFVFIGMPASECQNPLIIPLSAHELGHVIWNRKGAKQEFDPTIKQQILDAYKVNISDYNRIFMQNLTKEKLGTDLFSIRVIGASYSLAQRQVEETFCDLIALFVFGGAFLLAFRYLLAPSLGNTRDPRYPRIADRAKNLVDAAAELKFPATPDFAISFSDEQAPMPDTDAFVQKMADTTTRSLVPKLLDVVKKYKGNATKYEEMNTEENNALSCMRNLVPPLKIKSAEAIVNASWKLRLDIDNWDILDKIENKEEQRKEKLRILIDITLKGLEVFEYMRRIEKNAS